MTRLQRPRLIYARRPDEGVGEWLAAMVRGLDALDFLERSRELASEPVRATPRPTGEWAHSRERGKGHPRPPP